MATVYKITNRITGDFYVGKTKHFKKRIWNHKYKGIHSEKFENDIQKFGWDNFEVSVIEECSDEELHEKEAFYISALNPTYNSIVRGMHRSPETIEKIRLASTGVKQSKETIEKRKATILEYRKTHPQTNAGHKKRIATDYGQFGYPNAEFESVKSAAEFFGVHPSSVTKALKRNGKVRGVKVWYVV